MNHTDGNVTSETREKTIPSKRTRHRSDWRCCGRRLWKGRAGLYEGLEVGAGPQPRRGLTTRLAPSPGKRPMTWPSSRSLRSGRRHFQLLPGWQTPAGSHRAAAQAHTARHRGWLLPAGKRGLRLTGRKGRKPPNNQGALETLSGRPDKAPAWPHPDCSLETLDPQWLQ